MPPETPRKLLTLCVIHTDTHVLLGMKKRGFGEGRWNGFGGKVHPGEAIEAAARRELREEAGIEALDLRKRGVLTFEIAGASDQLEVHVFSATRIAGAPTESGEMRPRWFRRADIPYGQMWADDKYWLPFLLAGRNFHGRFYFLDDDNLLHYRLEEAGEAVPI